MGYGPGNKDGKAVEGLRKHADEPEMSVVHSVIMRWTASCMVPLPTGYEVKVSRTYSFYVCFFNFSSGDDKNPMKMNKKDDRA